MQTLVLGASGIVGNYIVQQLAAAGGRPLALSRHHHAQSDVQWVQGDLEFPESLTMPSCDVLFSTVHPSLARKWLENGPGRLRRVIQFTSSSISTKMETGTASERSNLQLLAQAEAQLTRTCDNLGIRWTILRPTIIYVEGRDVNVTKIARLIERFGFIPLAGNGAGLRQPVHAEDLAFGAIAAATSAAAENKIYALPGTDVVSYREMVGRVFDGMDRRRRIVSIPTPLWQAGFSILGRFFPGTNVSMGARMAQDMIFDPKPAKDDFGWTPRPFRPKFGQRRL